MTKRKPGRPKSGRKKAVTIKLTPAAHAALRATGNVSGEIERLALQLPQARVVTERLTCATCAYWERHTDDIERGYCLRFPPKIVDAVLLEEMRHTIECVHEGEEIDSERRSDILDGLAKMGHVAKWPAVWFDGVCGEHPDFPAYLASRVGPLSESPQ